MDAARILLHHKAAAAKVLIDKLKAVSCVEACLKTFSMSLAMT
jgi:hypothetical protein